MLEVIIIGSALSIGWHWLECMFRPALNVRKWSWLVIYRIPQGIIIAGALKMLGVI